MFRTANYILGVDKIRVPIWYVNKKVVSGQGNKESVKEIEKEYYHLLREVERLGWDNRQQKLLNNFDLLH